MSDDAKFFLVVFLSASLLIASIGGVAIGHKAVSKKSECSSVTTTYQPRGGMGEAPKTITTEKCRDVE